VTSGLLEAYDEQLRDRVPEPLPLGVTVEHDGPLLRFHGFAGRGFVGYRDLDGLHGDGLDELIERQVRVFGDRGEAFEWKLHAHDRPSDLAQRLTAAGFVAEDTETVLIAPVTVVAGEPRLPDGVTFREVTTRGEFERIGAMERSVWGDADDWLADMLASEHAADPESLTVVLAEAGADVVCAGWIRYEGGTDFATLWGGATLPAWRRRGIYRALVAYRANLAAARGYRYLEVDASDDSRPILQRLGFAAVTTTTPYVWAPPAG
jgi:GNAT superfamily N-acetyltransferase